MFATLFEVLLIEIQEEIHHFAGWEGGGVKGHKNCEQNICEHTGVCYLHINTSLTEDIVQQRFFCAWSFEQEFFQS